MTAQMAGMPDSPAASSPACSVRSGMPYNSSLRGLMVELSPISMSWAKAVMRVMNAPSSTMITSRPCANPDALFTPAGSPRNQASRPVPTTTATPISSEITYPMVCHTDLRSAAHVRAQRRRTIVSTVSIMPPNRSPERRTARPRRHPATTDARRRDARRPAAGTGPPGPRRRPPPQPCPPRTPGPG